MITELEKKLIRACIYNVKKDTSYTFLSTKTANSVKVSRSLNKILEGYTMLHNTLHKTKIGKSAYIHVMVKQFRDEQLAIFRQEKVDMALFDSDVLPAIQITKKILQQYVDENITGTNSLIMAMLAYRLIRDYEISVGIPVEDYRDLEFKSGGDLPEVETQVPAQSPLSEVPAPKVPVLPELTEEEKELTIDDLFEDDDTPLSIDEIMKGGK